MQSKLRRAERKIEKLTIKYPQLIKKDTIIDTINSYIPEYKFDTTFVNNSSDTIYIDNERLSIKYVRVGDTVYLDAKCKADTITNVVRVPYDRIVIRKQTFIESAYKFIKSIWWILLIVVVIGFLFKLAAKLIKPY